VGARLKKGKLLSDFKPKMRNWIRDHSNSPLSLPKSITNNNLRKVIADHHHQAYSFLIKEATKDIPRTQPTLNKDRTELKKKKLFK
jgi:spore maturation protein CgeB